MQLSKRLLRLVSGKKKNVFTKSYLADIVSRGATLKEMVKSDWFSSPVFLWQPEVAVVAVKGYDPHTYHVRSMILK